MSLCPVALHRIQYSMRGKGTGMFSACAVLAGGRGTTYETKAKENLTAATGIGMARIDGGSSAPGYFTKRIGIEELSYPFANTFEGLKYDEGSGYEIPASRYEKVFGTNGLTMYRFYTDPWNGSCYGLSGSTSMFSVSGNGVDIMDIGAGYYSFSSDSFSELISSSTLVNSYSGVNNDK